MLPVIALVGRPNVGKSTLFNRLTGTRDALVADLPGLTRDRQYGHACHDDRAFIVIDTGGLADQKDDLANLMAEQAYQAVEEADVVLFLVDARAGASPDDAAIAQRLRRTGKPIQLVVNKSEGLDTVTAASDFYALGLGDPLGVSAAHGQGVAHMLERAFDVIPHVAPETVADDTDGRRIRIAIVGRPNVGKSTLVNRMVGEDRVLAFDMPGTTRDSIMVPFERADTPFMLIDTAGVRRRSRVSEAIEKFSVIKALRALDAAHVAILVLDAREGVTEQDATLAGHVLESGRAVVVALNKWDGLDQSVKEQAKRQLDVKLPFLSFAHRYFISALHGTGVGHVLDAAQRAYQHTTRSFSTSELTRILEEAVESHQPPLVRGRRIKLRYAHQGGRNPPVIVVHGNQTKLLPLPYQRYLANRFRERLGLTGTPLRFEFRTGDNPFAGRKNKLTPRQQKRRRRMLRHHGKK